MVGMLQILTYMLAVYMVLKGVEIFQIGLVSNRESVRKAAMFIGIIALIASIGCAFIFVTWQEEMAMRTAGSL
ncbi:MAG: hypothetical protein HXY28_15230 [Hydrogenophilaceae bacterium]|jgi:hypothetical protein|nr:hypothetical protein [Hydrogenophilaceae bacterium]